ncbi:unnamed protein product, partial [Ectocarpus sp. 4 AP-2014]
MEREKANKASTKMYHAKTKLFLSPSWRGGGVSGRCAGRLFLCHLVFCDSNNEPRSEKRDLFSLHFPGGKKGSKYREQSLISVTKGTREKKFNTRRPNNRKSGSFGG